MLEELEQEVDPALAELMDVPGLGPERVRTLHEALGVTSRDELKKAAEHIPHRSSPHDDSPP